MRKVKQKKSNGLAKTRKNIFSKKKAALLRDLLLNVVVKQIIN